MDGSEESNKSFRLMQMSGNSTHQVTNVWIRTNSTVSGMYVQRFVITVVIKYIFAATEIGKDQG